MDPLVIERSYDGITWKYLPEVLINVGTPVEDFKQHLLPFVASEWRRKKLGIKAFDAGITNALFAIFDAEKGLKGSDEDVILLRVNGNGTDEIISRTDELISLVTLHQNGLTPPLYAQLGNGLCYGFVPGSHLSARELRDPLLMRHNAQALAKFHTVEVPLSFRGRPPLVWYKCDDWVEVAPRSFEDPTKQKCFCESIVSIEVLKKELDEMKRVLAECHSPIVFCHNDLLCANFIYNKDKDRVRVIDFEYAGPNYLAYDIGNHFCEFAGIDNVDYSLYPDESMQKYWIKVYLQEAANLKGDDPLTVTEGAVHSLYKQINKYALSAHLFWTVWALIQAVHSAIDFNYVEYAGLRFAEYKRRKQDFLSL